MLGAVDLSGLKSIQFKTDLISARALIIVILLKKRATMSQFVLNEPFGLRLLSIFTVLSPFYVTLHDVAY